MPSRAPSFWGLAGLALWAHGAALAQPDGQSLFTTETNTPVAAYAEFATERDAAPPFHRVGRVDHERLGVLREEVRSGRAGKLRLNLFQNVEYEASFERSAPTASGYTLSGPLDGIPFGRVVLVVNDGITMGRVYTPGGNWSIRTVGEMQTVERLATEPLRCGLEREPDTGDGAGPGGDAPAASRLGRRGQEHGNGSAPGLVRDEDLGRGSPLAPGFAYSTGAGRQEAGSAPGMARPGVAAASDDGGVVDVLVVYPSFAREFEGGYGPMLSLIDLDIATANEAYAASGVDLRVELAAAVEVEYDWFLDAALTAVSAGPFISNEYWHSAIEHLAGKDDGHLDEVHALRDRYAADLVLLHLGGEGTAWIASSLRGPNPVAGIAIGVYELTDEVLEATGFSVARSGDGTVVAHELGHSMGLHHDRHQDTNNKPFPYSHGFAYRHAPEYEADGSKLPSEWYGTIMSQYSNRERQGFVLAFSNPELVHPDDPDLRLGVPGDEPSSAADGPADATRHLNEVRAVLANVRASADADPCRYQLVGDVGQVPATGGTYRVRVETQPDCAWSLHSGRWVSAVSDREGTGSGEVSYTIAANDGWKRSVEVMVAGAVHARPQAGSRPITDVCERSYGVQFALRHSHPDVKYINPISGYEDWRDCEELNFDAEYLASLRTLDPGGNVNYWGVSSSELRPGDFDGLTGMFELWLNEVEHLPPGIFSDLTGLRVLNLGQRYLFGEDRAKLGSIAPGAFRGLPGLGALLIVGHRLRRLEAGTFEGLTGLVRLRITNAQGGTLRVEPGAFDDLSRLRRLTTISNGLTQLDAGLFNRLPALRSLALVDERIQALPKGLFGGQSKLRQLDLRVNRIEVLPSGALDGLSSLEEILLDDNRISMLEAGVFDGLTNLRRLALPYNHLANLPVTALAPLGKLESLQLSNNRLGSLEPGSFSALSELRGLYLGENRLERLQPNTFEGLSNLDRLGLWENGMRGIEPGAFEGLGSLSELNLWGNRLGVLRRGAFDGLDNLNVLRVRQGGVTSIEAGLFEATPRLRHLSASDNRIRELTRGALQGLRFAVFVDLQGNPGAPFTLAPSPVVVPSERGGVRLPVEVGVEVAPAVPFRVFATLAASGGSLSRTGLDVGAGEVRSWRSVTVTPDGDGPVTVSIDRELEVSGSSSYPLACGSGILVGLWYPACYRGFRLAAGPPLVLYGVEDRVLARGRDAETIDLVEVFTYFLGTADYGVSSSDETVAAARVEDGTLTVTPGAAGTAEITVTATGADGETLTRRFSVTVRVPSVPLFLSTSNPAREGFVRVINRSEQAGTVRITAIDDGGNRHGPVRLRIRANGAAQFNSRDLLAGNEVKRLLEGVGAVFVEGNWRLEFESDLDIEALSYVRTADGFLTALHDAAPFEDGVHRIATFNPASNVRQASRLRVVNPGREPAAVTVRGVDDAGASPGSPLRFSVPAGAAREFDAMQLESGDAGIEGALGDGEGKWRLTVESAAPLVAMSLLENTSTGHLTNLSSVPQPPDDNGIHHVGLLPAAGDAGGRQGFLRVINRSEQTGTVQIDAFDDAGVNYGPLELSMAAGAVAHFNSDDLELGAAGKGLTGSTGAGAGAWRLELRSDLDIEVLAYVRTEDGFLTAIHDAVAVRDGRRQVALFNPGSNTEQVSRLRLVNPLPEDVWVGIHGTDDTGGVPADGSALVQVPAGGALTVTAAELEAGIPDPNFEGYWDRLPLGDGRGKWRLSVVAEPEVVVQSLLESPTGHLTNLSSAPRAGAH